MMKKFKKYVSLLLAVMMALSCFTCAASVSAFAAEDEVKTPLKLGDVNGDGNVSVSDATLIQKHLAKLVTLTDEQLKAADLNGDGNVSISDATLIQKYVAKLIDKFPVEEMETEPASETTTAEPETEATTAEATTESVTDETTEETTTEPDTEPGTDETEPGTEPDTEPAEAQEGYYVVGSMTDWAPDAAYMLTLNEAAEGEEYMGTFTVESADTFKVAYTADGTTIEDTDWYPDGTDNNLTGYEGEITVYFRPEGDGSFDWISMSSDETKKVVYIAAASDEPETKPAYEGEVYTVYVKTTLSWLSSQLTEPYLYDVNTGESYILTRDKSYAPYVFSAEVPEAFGDAVFYRSLKAGDPTSGAKDIYNIIEGLRFTQTNNCYNLKDFPLDGEAEGVMEPFSAEKASGDTLDTIYVKDDANWGEVYFFGWGEFDNSDTIAAALVPGQTNIWQIDLPTSLVPGVKTFLFKNTAGAKVWDKQTADLAVDKGKNMYVLSSGTWETFSAE